MQVHGSGACVLGVIYPDHGEGLGALVHCCRIMQDDVVGCKSDVAESLQSAAFAFLCCVLYTSKVQHDTSLLAAARVHWQLVRAMCTCRHG
jgi:hypothetical protein